MNTGVSQKAVIFNEENKFLIIRRSKTAPYDPLTWDLPGGDLDYGEDANALVRLRETCILATELDKGVLWVKLKLI